MLAAPSKSCRSSPTPPPRCVHHAHDPIICFLRIFDPRVSLTISFLIAPSSIISCTSIDINLYLCISERSDVINLVVCA